MEQGPWCWTWYPDGHALLRCQCSDSAEPVAAYGIFALLFAAFHGHSLVPPRVRYTVLHWAARDMGPQGVATVQWLLGLGASPNARTRDGDTPVSIAACVGTAGTLGALLRGGGDASASSADGCTGLMGLVRFGVGDVEARLRLLLAAPGLSTSACVAAEQRARGLGRPALADLLGEEVGATQTHTPHPPHTPCSVPVAVRMCLRARFCVRVCMCEYAWASAWAVERAWVVSRDGSSALLRATASTAYV
jgi:hypothetical protein